MKGNRLTGIFLILFGALYLAFQVLGQFDIVLFRFWELWPLFTICIGLALEIGYFQSERNPGILIPGGIVTTIGFLHLFESLTNWRFSAYTWPLYILSVVVGFFQYWMVTKDRWALTFTYIMLAVFFFCVFIVASIMTGGLISIGTAFSVMIIVIGLLMLFSARQAQE